MAGYDGAGSYDRSRMNAGLGSRPALSITPATSPGAHLRRELSILLERRPALPEPGLTSDQGHETVWPLPRDGAADESIPMIRLGPYCVKVCRRVRLHQSGDGRLYAMQANYRNQAVQSLPKSAAHHYDAAHAARVLFQGVSSNLGYGGKLAPLAIICNEEGARVHRRRLIR